jgi:hypothetical protein
MSVEWDYSSLRMESVTWQRTDPCLFNTCITYPILLLQGFD